jgi:VanZ family protein
MVGIIEILQIRAPGRHARFEDFAVDALAAYAGFAAAARLDWARHRLHRNSNAS